MRFDHDVDSVDTYGRISAEQGNEGANADLDVQALMTKRSAEGWELVSAISMNHVVMMFWKKPR